MLYQDGAGGIGSDGMGVEVSRCGTFLILFLDFALSVVRLSLDAGLQVGSFLPLVQVGRRSKIYRTGR